MVNKIDPNGKMIFKQAGMFYSAFGNDALILNKYFGYKLYGVNRYQAGFGVAGKETSLEKINTLCMNYDLIDGKGNVIIAKRFDNNRYEIIDPEYPVEGVLSEVEEPAKLPRTSRSLLKRRLSKYAEVMHGLGEGINILSGEVLEGLSDELKAVFFEIATYFEEKLNSRKALEEKYPRHGRKWTVQEDEQLTNELAQGKSVNEISELHQRGRGSIIQRLLNLDLIEKPNVELILENEEIVDSGENHVDTSDNAVLQPFPSNKKQEDAPAKLEILCFSCKFYEECGLNGKTKCPTYEKAFNLSSHDKKDWAERGDSSTQNRLEDYKNALIPDLK